LQEKAEANLNAITNKVQARVRKAR
jgi:hypothetical protein